MARFPWKFRIKKSRRREGSRGLASVPPGVPVLNDDGLPQPEQVVSDRAAVHPGAPPRPGAEDEWLEQVRASGL